MLSVCALVYVRSVCFVCMCVFGVWVFSVCAYVLSVCAECVCLVYKLSSLKLLIYIQFVSTAKNFRMHVYVLSVCALVYGRSVCAQCMCFVCMCVFGVWVFSVCASCMYLVYVLSVCD